MLSSGCDVCACRVLLLEEVWIGEHATCPSLGSPDGVAPDSKVRRVIRGRGPYNAPFLTCRFCPGRMSGLKMIVFETEVTFFAHWATWCAEAKRNKSIYDGPPSLGFPRQRVFSIMARLSG